MNVAVGLFFTWHAMYCVQYKFFRQSCVFISWQVLAHGSDKAMQQDGTAVG
jgi:hypothetical protein